MHMWTRDSPTLSSPRLHVKPTQKHASIYQARGILFKEAEINLEKTASLKFLQCKKPES